MAKRIDRWGLVKRGTVWYLDYVAGGERHCCSTKETDLDRARAFRDRYVAKRGRARGGVTFATCAKSALEKMDALRAANDERRLSASEAAERHRKLGPDGPLCTAFGGLPVADVDADAINAFLDKRRVGKKQAAALRLGTKYRYCDAIQMTLEWARSNKHLPKSFDPVAEVREELRKASGTKAAREAQETRRTLAKDGVLEEREIGRLVAAAQADGLESYVAILFAIEMGMRRGEIVGAVWDDCELGADADDTSRAIQLRGSCPGGLDREAPKSGAARRPFVSRRLRAALLALRRERWNPSGSERIVTLGKPTPKSTYWALDVLLARLLRKAGLPARSWQHMRATCATRLRGWGLDEKWCQQQVGHSGFAVVVKHYLGAASKTYVPPPQTGPGEVPQDFFARRCVAESQGKSQGRRRPRRAAAKKS